ncbi:tripartite tricarboxylate transporter substrate binding protein [Pigmentiphaga soli]|uniref:Tripartite tricarboxylate transporter substrate binding protein n=1 Tax=Pigmentiphaga soli TaxID=1007095 RepID=A0ABP8H8K5_9BURK
MKDKRACAAGACGASRRRFGRYAAGAAVLAALPWTVAAQETAFPSKPIRIVVPFPPGGFNDTLARLVGKELQQAWGQPVVVDNKAGAATIIGTQAVASAAPDGYTMLVAAFGFATNPWVRNDLPYDTAKAFAPVILAARSATVLATYADSPYKTVPDVLAAAKANPGKLNYGTAGVAASNHLAMVLFQELTHTTLNHVPYKGGSPALTDLASGRLDVSFDLLPNAMPFIQAGKLRALAVADRKRSPLMPDVPTVEEAGGPKIDVPGWHGFVVPAGTPPAIVAKLNREINRILRLPHIREEFQKQGVTPEGGSVDEFRTFIDGQLALWKGVIERNGIRVD